MRNRKDREKKEKEDCSHSDWLNETSSIFCNVIRPNINLPQTILIIKYNSSFLLISYLWGNVSDILGSVKSDEKSRWIKVVSLGDELKRWAEMMNWSDKFRRWIEAIPFDLFFLNLQPPNAATARCQLSSNCWWEYFMRKKTRKGTYYKEKCVRNNSINEMCVY